MRRMPWTATTSYSHPLANVQSSTKDTKVMNLISYSLIDALTWQGLGDIINTFRCKTLGLEPISKMWAPGMSISSLHIPFTYCWLAALHLN